MKTNLLSLVMSLLLGLLTWTNGLQAQVQGAITDLNGEPLIYATVYEEGSMTGTTSNLDGNYTINLSAGTHTLVFQYVGFKPVKRSIIVDDTGDLNLDIMLEPQAYSLDQIEIVADAEDPAYRVIREAIKKREYYLNHVPEYKADVYVKGNTKVLQAPEKILGMEVGDMEGALDSNRQGIVYLSESVSEYYHQAPDKSKEIMISSKTSGDDRGYSFNSASDMDMNFYKNTIDGINRSLISPIASNALNFYRYQLIGTQYDDSGRLINKIKVIPKRDSDPVFHGEIYIIEDIWNIESVELSVSKQASHIYILDTLTFTQQYLHLEQPDQWLLFSNTAAFDMSVFGFRFAGVFSAFYSSYDTSIRMPDDFFNSELMKVEKESNERDSAYWDVIRPIPLTTEENVDYVRKDSIYEVRHSPAYLDSIDRKNNKLGIMSPLTGYDHQNSMDHRYINFTSPLGNVNYNTVQGYTTAVSLNIDDYADDKQYQYFKSKTKVQYGFADRKFRFHQSLQYLFNSVDYSRVTLSGGMDVVQFGEREMVKPFFNDIYSLFLKKNYLKLFEKKNINLQYRREMNNGVWIHTSIEYANKSPLNNSASTSYFYKDSRVFSTNNPRDSRSEGTSLFQSFHGVYLGVNLTFRPGQKYLSYPDYKIIVQNTKPNFGLIWNAGFTDNANYHEIAAVMSGFKSLKTWGWFNYRFRAGAFINGDDIAFPDYKHFKGNQLGISDGSNYTRTYLNLPYYSHSTNGTYIEAHVHQNFRGRIIDRIPLLKKTGFYLAAGAKYLYTEEQGHYQEFHFGLDNIGINIFRGLRFDTVLSYQDGEYRDIGFVLALKVL